MKTIFTAQDDRRLVMFQNKIEGILCWAVGLTVLAGILLFSEPLSLFGLPAIDSWALLIGACVVMEAIKSHKG